MVGLQRRNSDAGTKIELLGITASFLRDGGRAVAELALAPGKLRKLVKLLNQAGGAGAASVAFAQKLAGKLFLAQAAIKGRFGRRAM